MSGPTLHDMAEQYRKLLDAALSEVDPETGEMADAFDVALRAIEDSIERKVDGYSYVREALEAWAGRLTKDATRLVKRAKTVAGRIERMENELRDAFVLGKLSRVDGERCSVTVKAPASAVDVFAVALIPPELMRTPDPPAPEPNKVEIAKRLKAGQEVPGARMKEGRRAVLWA